MSVVDYELKEDDVVAFGVVGFRASPVFARTVRRSIGIRCLLSVLIWALLMLTSSMKWLAWFFLLVGPTATVLLGPKNHLAAYAGHSPSATSRGEESCTSRPAVPGTSRGRGQAQSPAERIQGGMAFRRKTPGEYQPSWNFHRGQSGFCRAASRIFLAPGGGRLSWPGGNACRAEVC